MTTMAENGVVHTPHDALGAQVNATEKYPRVQELWGVGSTSLKPSCVPLFSQNLLTVEQLTKISVDPDIQSSVNDFLKGLTTQMFARIVRNGSTEVGSWLGAKIQGERDGWLTMLRTAMEEIEFHRKNALQAQVHLHDSLDQLRLLVDCFQVEEEAKSDVMSDDVTRGIHACVRLIAQCCNALMEDRFRCVDILGCAESIPDSVSSVVQQIKDKMDQLGVEKDTLRTQCNEMTQINSTLLKQNEHLMEQVQKMGDRVKSKQTDLESLKTQLKEVDQCVVRKTTTAEKCVGTTLDLFQQGLGRRAADSKTQPAHDVEIERGETRCESCDKANNVVPEAPLTRRETVQRRKLPVREPSFIELSEEKLRVLKERARKLEDSLHGALANMDRVRSNGNATSSDSNAKPTTASTTSLPTPAADQTDTVVALPIHCGGVKDNVTSWVRQSFQVGNQTGTPVTSAAVPKLGHFKPTGSDRRCFSERPPDRLLSVTDSPSRSNVIPSLTGVQARGRSQSVVSPSPHIGGHPQASPSGRKCEPLTQGASQCKGGNHFSLQLTTSVSEPVSQDALSLNREPTRGKNISARVTHKAQGAHVSAAETGSKQQRGPDVRRANRAKVSQVSKCLRCQRLFTATDNHKLACCFHGKGKERVEVYSEEGQLVKVNYVWKCCQQPGDTEGCCYGHHV